MSRTLQPLHLGRIRVEFPVILSALAGYSDLAYRLICRRLGAAFCLTEVMLDKSLIGSHKVRTRLSRLSDQDHPVGGQIMGCGPDEMAAAAEILCRKGFDTVDLNFACPVRKALSRRRGGWMMKQPDLAVEITRAVLAVADRPVTLKLRRSFDGEGEAAFWQIAESAFEAGAAAVCVHARTVEAKYTGPADWDFLAAVKRRFPDRTIIGSGDVLAPADALRMLDQTGVDGVAAARGVLGNPWFFRQVRDLLAGREPRRPTVAEQRELLIDHFASACELYGPVRGPKTMRKFGIRYARLHPRARDIRMAFVAVKNPDQWHEVIRRYYSDPCDPPHDGEAGRRIE